MRLLDPGSARQRRPGPPHRDDRGDPVRPNLGVAPSESMKSAGCSIIRTASTSSFFPTLSGLALSVQLLHRPIEPARGVPWRRRWRYRPQTGTSGNLERASPIGSDVYPVDLRRVCGPVNSRARPGRPEGLTPLVRRCSTLLFRRGSGHASKALGDRGPSRTASGSSRDLIEN